MARRATRLARRLRFGVVAATIIAATTVSCVMANLIAERLPARVDVTAMGEHRLSARTSALLGSLDGAYEIVLAADWQAKDRRVADRVLDAVDRFGRSSEHIKTTVIDTGSARGLAEYDRLLDRLAAREADAIEEQTSTIDAAAAELDDLATFFEGLGRAEAAIAEQLTGEDATSRQSRTYFEQRAGAAQAAAAELRRHAETTRTHLEASMGPVRVPAADEARTLLAQVFRGVDTQLASLAGNLRAFADAEGLPEEARALARQLEPTVRTRRDEAAVVRERVDRLESLDLARVARVLDAGEAAIVIGPDGVVGVDTTMLLPPGRWLDETRGVGSDIGRRAEELLASAIGSLATPARPIVVVVHGQPGAFIDQVPIIDVVRERLELHGVDFVEWPAVAEPDEPDLSELDPRGDRPVVYVVIGTDTSAGSAEGQASGPERAEALGRVLDRLATEGQPVLMSLVPSTLPGFGLDDPTVRFLSRYGLTARTGRPIVQEAFGQGGRAIVTDRRIEASASDHPLYGALRGMPTMLTWPIAIEEAETPAGVELERTPLYEITDADSWGESQWVALWQTPADRRASLPNPPTRDPERDMVDGPWTVASAVERRAGGRSQRLVVVGSFDWFFDRWTGEATLIDERIVPTNPGNAELFDAAILWLAGQDDLIAQSPTARATPRIGPIDAQQLTVLRWSLVGGLPGLVLLLGGLWWLLSR